MNKVKQKCGIAIIVLGIVCVIGGIAHRMSSPDLSSSDDSRDLLTDYHLGLNFFVFDGAQKSQDASSSLREMSATETAQDLEGLHADVARQFTNGDVLWSTVNPKPDVWNWETTDDVIRTIAKTSEPIVTLFSLQYASPNAPWNTRTTFSKTMTSEAETYVRTVVRRYKDTVTYWEIGNEMDHWRSEDPNDAAVNIAALAETKAPANAPKSGFSPAEQGAFLAAVAAIIRTEDSDAVIVMPGMSAINEYTMNTWLPGIIDGAGKEAFDVVNYHDYGSWDGMQSRIDLLKKTMKTLGIISSPIWLTETGSTASSTLTVRTEYPNSPVSQAADVIRRPLTAFANGITVTLWHTYFSSSDERTNRWRAYGLYDADGNASPAYSVYKTLTDAFPASSIENISPNAETFIMKITSINSEITYAVWGTSGTWALPPGITAAYTITDSGLSSSPTSPGSTITLSSTPQLFR